MQAQIIDSMDTNLFQISTPDVGYLVNDGRFHYLSKYAINLSTIFYYSYKSLIDDIDDIRNNNYYINSPWKFFTETGFGVKNNIKKLFTVALPITAPNLLNNPFTYFISLGPFTVCNSTNNLIRTLYDKYEHLPIQTENRSFCANTHLIYSKNIMFDIFFKNSQINLMSHVKTNKMDIYSTVGEKTGLKFFIFVSSNT